MALTDTQKGLYLQEMGIQTYFPRRPLPGAKPSRAYAANAWVASVPTETKSQSAAATAKDVLELLKPAATPASIVVAQPEPAPEPAEKIKSPVADEAIDKSIAPAAPEGQTAKAAEQQSPLRFAFAFIPVSEHLAVISELPWSANASLSSASLMLLSGILKALGLQVEPQHLNPMVFTWPLFEGAGLELDTDSARKTLEGFVLKRIRLRPVKNLLVMAEESAPLLFSDGFLQDKGAVFQHPRLDLRVIMTHSLSAMEPVQDPAMAAKVKERKGTTWKTLQPLQTSLNGN